MMTRLTLLCTWVLAAGCLWGAAGDQITLKNGDRYSGTIVKSDAKELVLKTEFAGTVTIQWDAVTARDRRPASDRGVEGWTEPGGPGDHLGR